MTEKIMTLQICNGAMQVTKDSILYLAEKLQEATDAAEPNYDELRACYYDAENISRLLIDCADDLKEGLEKSEGILQEIRNELKKKG